VLASVSSGLMIVGLVIDRVVVRKREKKNAEIQSQRLRTVQDIVNNFLNDLLLFRIEGEHAFLPESLKQFDDLVQGTSAKLKTLGDSRSDNGATNRRGRCHRVCDRRGRVSRSKWPPFVSCLTVTGRHVVPHDVLLSQFSDLRRWMVGFKRRRGNSSQYPPAGTGRQPVPARPPAVTSCRPRRTCGIISPF
jgi:hypothetical protein